jgi:hypothetical protein
MRKIPMATPRRAVSLSGKGTMVGVVGAKAARLRAWKRTR